MLHTVKQEAVEMKEINIPVGISDFKEICKNGCLMVLKFQKKQIYAKNG